MILSAVCRQIFELWGTGSPLREFLYSDDMADACVFLLENYSGERHVNIGTGKEVIAKIKAMANANYVNTGYGKVKKMIDDMPADQVKEYLKKLIEDNIVVGIEIINGQR